MLNYHSCGENSMICDKYNMGVKNPIPSQKILMFRVLNLFYIFNHYLVADEVHNKFNFFLIMFAFVCDTRYRIQFPGVNIYKYILHIQCAIKESVFKSVFIWSIDMLLLISQTSWIFICSLYSAPLQNRKFPLTTNELSRLYLLLFWNRLLSL